jgi:hypothetical protein
MIQPINNYEHGKTLPMTTLEERIVEKLNEMTEKINEIEKWSEK